MDSEEYPSSIEGSQKELLVDDYEIINNLSEESQSEQISNRLKKIELQILKNERQKFFYSLRDEFLNNDALEFENCRNEQLVIDAKNK